MQSRFAAAFGDYTAYAAYAVAVVAVVAMIKLYLMLFAEDSRLLLEQDFPFFLGLANVVRN